MDLNFTTEKVSVLNQARTKEDYVQIKSLTTGSSNSVIASLIIPFAFMVFLSISMNRAWSLYLMLQVVSNINRFEILIIPATAKPIILMMEWITNFKIMENETVQKFMKKYVFKNLSQIQEYVTDQGTVFIAMIICGFALFTVLIVQKCKIKLEIKQKIKNLVMWTPIFRSIIQFYLITSIGVFSYIRDYHNIEFKTCLTKIIEYITIMTFPLTYILIQKNYDVLHTEDCKKLYSPLYENLYTKKSSVYTYMVIFCVNRLLLAFNTSFFNYSTLPCVYILIFFSSIFQMAYHLKYNPMITRVMNHIEKTNILVIYLTSYYMLIFT